MNLDLTDEETAALLRELDGLIDGDRYFMSQRIKTLNAIRAKIRPEPARERCLRRRSPMRHRERQRSRDGARGAELPGRLAAPCKRRDFAGSLRRAVARRVCSNLRNYVANTPKRLVFGKRGRAFRSPPPSCPTPMLAPGNPAEPQGSWPSLRGRVAAQPGPDTVGLIERLTAVP
jgi:hypothetical protein